MKKIIALFMSLILILGLCACSAKVKDPTWQEQYDLGVRYLSEGNYQEAILAFTAAIEIDPKRTEAYEKLTDVYLALGDTDAAVQALRDGYAATGDASFQARIDELIASELTSAPIQNQDFIINDGELVEYIGPGGDVTIPGGVTSIAVCAFQFTNVTSVTIPSSVTSIEFCAYYGCTNLTSIDIPSSVTSIGGALVFGGCSSLQACNVAVDNQYYSSNDGVLFNKTQTAVILYPEGRTATSYTIPSGVTSISEYAFEGCSKLTNITIPNSVTRIECYAFEGCGKLTSVTIPSGVTSIEFCTFNGCTSLTSIDIPSSVTSIENGAFFGCTSLTSITIPSSVTNIEIGAFINCNQLTDIYYTGTEEQWAAISIGDRSNDALQSATIHFNS